MSESAPTLTDYRNRKARAADFIAAAQETHERRYGYEHVAIDFTNAHSPVRIVCIDHGIFTQAPNEHRQGQACPDCSGRRNASASSRAVRFLERAHATHGDRYAYDEVRFVDQKTPVVIGCRRHGQFEQRPTNHLDGGGCRDCAQVERMAGRYEVAAKRVKKQRRDKEGKFIA